MTDFLSQRRDRIAEALRLDEAILLVGAGEPVPLPEGSDQTYPFRSHAEYFYLTAQECARGVVAFDPRDANGRGWVSFVPEVTESERVWEAREQLPGSPLAELKPWLAARTRRPVVMLGVPLPEVEFDASRTADARAALTHARRPKDATEIAQMRRAVHATSAGFARVRAVLQPGVTERLVQIELEAEFARHGGQHTGYGTIVGAGPNSAVLHFEPGTRAAREGDFVLIDAGAEIDRYTADVTRTFVVGRPSAFQRDFYQVVLAAQQRAVARCVPGAEWRELHLATAVDLVDGLVQLGLMRGNAQSLVEQDAHTLFYPHGLGHMVGLGVRDASGLAPGRLADPRPSLRTLRMDLPLAPGYLVTVEPGLYFIPALLNDPVRRRRYRECVNWPLVEQHLSLGGVRIEDNILVTSAAPDVLTSAIPKALA
jgi:Xaa-Pro aminopeptidase